MKRKDTQEQVYHQHDVGYKHIFSHKGTFLELIRSFINKDWVNLIEEDDLVLADKSYILSDFEEEESDIVYKINIEGQEVIFYVLLEFQSRVDFQMPIRLLFYMTEIWRDVLKNTLKKDRRKKEFKLPSVVPIVIYNGKNRWTANTNFKEMLQGYELFGDNVLDFNYILFDVNRYDKEDLLEIANMVSLVFLLEQNISKEELVKRLRSSAFVLKRIKPEQFDVFKKWLKGIVKPRLDKNSQEQVDEILDKSNQGEVDDMVSNLGKTLDKIKEDAIKEGRKEGIQEGIQQGIQQGKLEGRLETARNLLRMGMDLLTVVKATGLSHEEIEKIKKNMN
ncbi:Rpn family recombination-promoting nuclease/putative transposase [Clostridium sp. MB40-C1]|uniref:Rpn family recombination-promoting nuclease/putative transposase n=1 Tax=Clostridium sp. MB40-C1 TaxID=3070996 RepID=UPI0027DEDDA7|nr:Rpn family recombination-promoting nuclease/putative transposase [Clostridium sp. MB40-C1]WMJ82291.1 Rpn family recombination-promoting nuclease/putative transposase [Clostridium sp. MB40-C1]